MHYRKLTYARRWAFAVVGYGVLMVILAGSGLKELYLSNLTFGAELWSDYLTLFAWGFGAEATRSSFMRLASSWGLPGIRR